MSLCGLRLNFWSADDGSLYEPLRPAASQPGIVQQTAAVAGQAVEYLLLLPARMRAAKLDWQQISQMQDVPLDLLAAMTAQQLIHVPPRCFTEGAVASLMALPSGRYNLLHARPGTYDYGLVHPDDAVQALMQLSSDAIDTPRAYDYARMARVLTEVRHVEAIVASAPHVLWIIVGSLRPTLLRDLVDQGWFDTAEHMKSLLRHISIDQVDKVDRLFNEPRRGLLRALYRSFERRHDLGFAYEKAYNFSSYNRQYYDPSSEVRIVDRTLKNMMAHYRIGTHLKVFDYHACKGEATQLFTLLTASQQHYTDTALTALFRTVIRDCYHCNKTGAEEAVDLYARMTHVRLHEIVAELGLEKGEDA